MQHILGHGAGIQGVEKAQQFGVAFLLDLGARVLKALMRGTRLFGVGGADGIGHGKALCGKKEDALSGASGRAS